MILIVLQELLEEDLKTGTRSVLLEGCTSNMPGSNASWNVSCNTLGPHCGWKVLPVEEDVDVALNLVVAGLLRVGAAEIC